MDQKNFESHWTNYATRSRPRGSQSVLGGLAAATGAAIFSLQARANADIVYVPEDLTIGWSNTHANSNPKVVALPGGPGVGFNGYFINNTSLLRGQTGKGNVDGVKVFEGQVVTSPGGTLGAHLVKKFASGAVISKGSNFQSANQFKTFQEPLHVQSGGKLVGQFPINATQDYFLGLKLANGDIGYIKLAVKSTSGNAAYANELDVLGYAYNNSTIPGDSITAGAMPEPDAATLITPLLLLAGGAGALKAWRERKKSA